MIKQLLIIAALIFLSGCQTSKEPAYPSDLALIIAQSNQPPAAQVPPVGDKSISVAQLLQSVRETNAGNPAAAVKPQARSNWQQMLQSAPQRVAQKATAPPQPEAKREFQLHYPAGQNQPYEVQLLMAKRLAAEKQLVLINVAVGTSSGKSAFESVSNARTRANQLVAQFKTRGTPQIEYKPALGDDLVVVTLAPAINKGNH